MVTFCRGPMLLDLGIFIVQSRAFKCSIDEAKRCFYRAANAVFGKIGRLVSEEVTLHLLKTKCIPVLFYGLKVLQLNKSQISSIDFVINRFFMLMFNTNNIEIVKCCQHEFCFSLPSVTLTRRTEIFLGKIRQCENQIKSNQIFFSVQEDAK